MRVSRGRPMVTLKLALSLDGRIATASGESRWITGAAARARVHALRASHDAVLVGSGTARADDPALTVRGLGVAAQPVRVVFDSRLSHAPDSALGRSAREVPVWMVHTAAAPEAARQAWEAAGARLIGCSEGTLDAAAALSALGAAGLTRVFCEGGGQLAASLMRADAVDEVIGFSAGLALGGDGRASLGPLGLRHLAEAPRFRLVAAAQVGADLMHRWERA
jgi:diaminohydroxyphosphoribosylaminopyrimidine deaminase/5-amino-6-(5-phosphoribosylamino)uracil reductase